MKPNPTTLPKCGCSNGPACPANLFQDLLNKKASEKLHVLRVKEILLFGKQAQPELRAVYCEVFGHNLRNYREISSVCTMCYSVFEGGILDP